MCGDKSVTRISDAYYLMQLISKILFFFFVLSNVRNCADRDACNTKYSTPHGTIDRKKGHDFHTIFFVCDFWLKKF